MPDMPEWPNRARLAKNALATGLKDTDTGQIAGFTGIRVNAMAVPRVLGHLLA